MSRSDSLMTVFEAETPTQVSPSSAVTPKLAATIGTNTIFGILAGGASLATRFITIPIVIAHLGLGGYGIWAIIMTAATYMRFGAVGVKSAFQKYVAEATADVIVHPFEGVKFSVRGAEAGC